MAGLGTTVGGGTRRALTLAVAAVGVVALIVVGAVVATARGGKTYHLTAYFTSTVGLYTGNDVRILGVKVGRIDSITPAGSQVKVVMSYNGDDKVPATADAVIVEPSIVSDRYIQLTPGYTNGQALADHAVLPVGRTRVPIELDQVFGNINDLDKALGPSGANRSGSLSKLITVGAANLNGNGAQINKTLKAFSAAVSTLSGSRGDLFATVNHLQKFTSTLAANDGGVRQLNANLALVGGQLAAERQDLGAALVNLATALQAVNSFVASNRSTLTGDIHGLTKVTNVLAKEKEAITQFTDVAPLALSDISLSYDPVAETLDTKSDAGGKLPAGEASGTLCILLTQLSLTNLLPGVSGCSSSTTATAATPTVQPGKDRAHSLAGLLAVSP
jgi:phospholipid/cholesterol/gamma-HCH transport system substrate-binding protein